MALKFPLELCCWPGCAWLPAAAATAATARQQAATRVPTCLVDADCSSGTRCSTGKCTKILCVQKGSACTTSDVCATGNICLDTKEATSVCWPSGATSPLGYSCFGNECIASLSCNVDDYFCTEPGQLATRCNATSDCLAGLICLKATPVRGYCADSGVCRNSGGYGDYCCDNSDCTAPLTCIQDTTTTTLSSKCRY